MRDTPWVYAKGGTCSQPAMPASAIPPELRECSVDGDCLKVASRGCCSETLGAVRAEFLACVMPAMSSVNCDRVCDRGIQVPPNALTLAAVCVKGLCELR